MPLHLTCIGGDCVPQQLAIDGPLTLGRDPGCDLRLHDDRASRLHARIEAGGNGWQVVDSGSANGLLVDGERVERATLRDGQVVQLGGVTFAISGDDAGGGATRVVTDTGAALTLAAERATALWREGDDPDGLAPAHRCLRAVHAAAPGRAAEALARAAARELGCSGAAVVLRGRASCVAMEAELAQRLAGGTRARLLRLGRELVGATIAAARIGSALSAPLSGGGHLVAVRGVDDDPPGERELALIATIAAEVELDRAAADDLSELVGDSEPMRHLRARVARVAATDAAVLITGESGTGKELVARALHRCSGRAAGAFVAVNCAALAGELFEAELFGHERGAFTGAERARPGRFRTADGGTLFLDEIGELGEPLQAKLLRVLQEGVVEPVGGEPVAVDVRVVAATNRDLQAAVDAGRFRDDLFYRLDVIRITTPPLRARRGDIPALARHLLQLASEDLGLPPLPLGPAAADALAAREWPGNVRQLANQLTRALIAAEGPVIDLTDLEPAAAPLDSTVGDDPAAPFPTLAELEAAHVAAALRRTGGNRTQAARLLGVSRPTILKKITDYGIDTP